MSKEINITLKTGTVYKIYSTLNPNEIYIGSTIQKPHTRFLGHKSHYKNGRNISVKIIFDKYGVDTCIIEIIEQKQINESSEIMKLEQIHIEQNNCINKRAAYMSRKDTTKLYRERNHDEINKKCICNICGNHYIKKHKQVHLKSKKCQSKVSKESDSESE